MKLLNLRIPYQGSKNKIAETLILEMQKYKPNAKYFYDMFGGGGSMSFTAIQMGYKVIYNEYDSDLTLFMQYIVDRIKSGEKSKYGFFPEEYYSFVTREMFMEQKKLHTVYSEFCRIVYSFGNNRHDYMFSRDLEKSKHLAHNFVVFKCEKSLKEFNEFQKTNLTISNAEAINDRRLHYTKEIKKEKRIDLERLEQLEQLQQLERLQQLDNFIVLNKSYDEIEIPYKDDDVIIYCDPPYEKTKCYRNKKFDHNKFNDWVKNKDKTVFLSEYNSEFFEIFNIKKRCTMNKKLNNLVLEKLYCNKNLEIVKNNEGLF